MAVEFPLVIVTPSSMAFEGEARSVLAPGTDGYFEVLIGHVPMLTSLRPGLLTIRNDEGRTQYTVSGGFVEVLRAQVTVLAETIEEVGAIDLDRARQAEERARQRLGSGEEDVDVDRARASLDRAVNRIKATQQ
ncbi:MAG: ATP synthase F1 subunit epsilon [Gemmatimonadetes bacterium]|nr:ATP synthase F1 subunit epsilon [Gemmatimonadota bacterium]